MEAVNRERRAQRQNAMKTLGVSGDRTRSLVSEVQAVGLDAEILSLPFLKPQQALQDSSGAPLFMVGISAVGGADPIG